MREQHENIGVFCWYRDMDCLVWSSFYITQFLHSQNLQVVLADYLGASFHSSEVFSNFHIKISQNY